MAIKLMGGTSAAEVDSSSLLKALRVAPYPVQTAAAYSIGATSGTVAAGASADSIVFSIRNPSTTKLARVKRLHFSVHTLGTGFTAGVALFYLKVVRSFTAADTTGGTAISTATNFAKLRTSLDAAACTAYIADTGAITAGTGTADTTALKRSAFTFSTAVQTVLADKEIFVERPGDYPLVLAQDEGLRLYATVPATGTWVLNVNCEWDELTATELGA